MKTQFIGRENNKSLATALKALAWAVVKTALHFGGGKNDRQRTGQTLKAKKEEKAKMHTTGIEPTTFDLEGGRIIIIII